MVYTTKYGAATSVAKNKSKYNATKVASPESGVTTSIADIHLDGKINATEVISPLAKGRT